MQIIAKRRIIYLIVDFLLLLLCIINAPTVLDRARVPFTLMLRDHQLIVDEIINSKSVNKLQKGDIIIAWNSENPLLREQNLSLEVIEFLEDISSINQKVEITYQRGSFINKTVVSLISYYHSPRFLIVSLCVGLITWLIGIFILLNKKGNHIAEVLHWALIVLSVSVMITWGRIDSHSLFSYYARTIFFVCYTLIPALFFLFTSEYPVAKWSLFKWKTGLLFFISVILIIGQTYFHLQAIHHHSVQYYVKFQAWFRVFNVYLLLLVIGAILNLLHSRYYSFRIEDKRRLEWILWGFCISPVPFLLLIKIPQLFGVTTGLVAEEFTTIFFLLIPFSFTVSLVKYNILDIQLIINRSIVYTGLTLFIGIIYSLIVLLLASSFDTATKFKEYILIGGIILLTAFALNPVRKRLQNFVDESLFPARINFRRTVTEVREALRKCMTSDEVYDVLQKYMSSVVPFVQLAFYINLSGTLILKLSKTPDHTKTIVLTKQQILYIKQKKIFEGENAFDLHNSPEHVIELLNAVGCSMLFPIFGELNELLGIVAIAPSETVHRLSEEEIDLITTFNSEAGEEFNKLLLQEKIIVQKKEKERFEELSNLKSYFVSSISHELQTPLTSIRMFSEMLSANKNLSLRQRSEYLTIIRGESERLSRLVENVLDFGKIEREEKVYQFDLMNLSSVVRKSVNIMGYQFAKHKGILRTSIAKNIPQFYADADALEEVTINLLSNALKYSSENIFVRLYLKRLNNYVVLEITDQGIGIPENELKNIFDKYYRVRNSHDKQSGGAGLGLTLVKHIVDVHGGDIRVRSIVGKGSTFTIRLPLKR